MFTIFVIVAGVISAAFIVGGIVQIVTEGEIHRALDSHRKTRDLASLKNHAIVCGYGRIGQVLARQLAAAEQPFVIVDNSSDRIASAEDQGYLVCPGNATDELILQSAGIERAKVLATVLPDDALNVFISLTARELNPDLTIVARGRNAQHREETSPRRCRSRGFACQHQRVTHGESDHASQCSCAVLDEDEDHARLNELLSQLDVQIDELNIASDSPLAGRTIADLEVRGKGAFIVVALRRKSEGLVLHPDHSEQIQDGDSVIVLGHCGDLPQFVRLYKVKTADPISRRGYQKIVQCTISRDRLFITVGHSLYAIATKTRGMP